MRYSDIFIPTLREIPSEADAVSHVLMLRGGYIRQLGSGLYIYLPLALRVLERINRIIREEMNTIGAQEIIMPSLHPADVWKKTGRWEEIGDEMFRLTDRGERDMCLGMTHEEVITWLASSEIRSYRELPQVWYQIQTKFRDEARPKSGILRTREFTMKDSYSFDRDEKGLEMNYEKHAGAYHRIFSRCGLRFYQVDSDPGMMGGATAHEFMAPSPAGEDTVVLCDSCGYAANIELAQSIPVKQHASSIGEGGDLKDIETPSQKTVEEVSRFLDVHPSVFIKSLLLIGCDGPFLALLRGDQELHEKKLQNIVGEFRVAEEDEVKNILGVEAGFIGPHEHSINRIADVSLREGVYISGANREGYHTGGIRPFEHFDAQWQDIHLARIGEKCVECGGNIRMEEVIEIGNIFKLGTKYSLPLRALYLDEHGVERPLVMGSYGIGPARIAAAAIEQNHDAGGIVWPEGIAPFDVEIIPLNMDDKDVISSSETLYEQLTFRGIQVLMDDRDVRPGVKFKDADLIGIPYHVVVGRKALNDGCIELKMRKTGLSDKVATAAAVERIEDLLKHDS